jgi:alpha-glucan,water dikinase
MALPSCPRSNLNARSNNGDDFWNTLKAVGKLTKEDLANFDKPITAFPLHLPHMIDPMKHYL